MSTKKIKQAIRKGDIEEARALLRPYLQDKESQPAEIYRLAAQVAVSEEQARDFDAQADFLEEKEKKSKKKSGCNTWITILALLAIILVWWASQSRSGSQNRNSSAAASSHATNTPALGTRLNPLPAGDAYEIRDGRFQVNNLQRDMDSEVEQMNMFNLDPEPGQEWVLVNVTFFCDLPAERTCVTSRMYFEMVGDSGEVYDMSIGVVLDDAFGSEVYGGGQDTGVVGFMIQESESDLLFVVKDGGSRTFFAAPEKE